jgi:hypothetical protein
MEIDSSRNDLYYNNNNYNSDLEGVCQKNSYLEDQLMLGESPRIYDNSLEDTNQT